MTKTRYSPTAERIGDLIKLLIATRAPLTTREIQQTLAHDRLTLTHYCNSLVDKGLVERAQAGNAFTYRWIGQE